MCMRNDFNHCLSPENALPHHKSSVLDIVQHNADKHGLAALHNMALVIIAWHALFKSSLSSEMLAVPMSNELFVTHRLSHLSPLANN